MGESGVIGLCGARLRAQRQRLGLTLAQAAATAGISARQLLRLEQGACPNVQAGTLVLLTRALHTTSDYLLGLSPEPGA